MPSPDDARPRAAVPASALTGLERRLCWLPGYRPRARGSRRAPSAVSPPCPSALGAPPAAADECQDKGQRGRQALPLASSNQRAAQREQRHLACACRPASWPTPGTDLGDALHPLLTTAPPGSQTRMWTPMQNSSHPSSITRAGQVLQAGALLHATWCDLVGAAEAQHMRTTCFVACKGAGAS
jgi:hypothetical protein